MSLTHLVAGSFIALKKRYSCTKLSHVFSIQTIAIWAQKSSFPLIIFSVKKTLSVSAHPAVASLPPEGYKVTKACVIIQESIILLDSQSNALATKLADYAV